MARTILLATESRAFNNRIADYFIHRGWQITQALNIDQCMNAIRNSDLDAIVLDWNLTGASGWGVLDCLDVNHAASEIPVVILANRLNQHLPAANGSIQHVLTPCNVADIGAAIARLSNSSRGKTPFDALRRCFAVIDIES